MPPLIPLKRMAFSLDISSLAGFLGADAALAVMMLPHLHSQRKWWGWYNCPGSYYLAKRYGQMARFKFLSPSYERSAVPERIALELDGATGPAYHSARSGATLPHTGPFAPMLVEECAAVDAIEVRGRRSHTMEVAIVRVERKPEGIEYPRVPYTYPKWLRVLPLAATLSTVIACTFYHDWYTASVILFSALCHGLACLAMGNAKLTYQHRIPLQTARFASGWMEAQRSFIVLCGTEAAITPITRGRFSLSFAHSKGHSHVSLCSMLLATQFLSQLLLVPQGTLFGQVMFIASLIAAWAYHRLILARGKESVQRRLLMADILGGPQIRRYRFGTRTAAAVFTVLALRPAIRHGIEARLKALLPTNTPVWELWYATVARKIDSGLPLTFEEECKWEWQKMKGLLTREESLLFRELLLDATAAYEAFREHHIRILDWPRHVS
ncbi:hypothetical protein BD414DRAFT_138248 [Trametes punicea]|nr:hypothetical protein BD414DRAFT_138248 [Trametes punicea]